MAEREHRTSPVRNSNTSILSGRNITATGAADMLSISDQIEILQIVLRSYRDRGYRESGVTVCGLTAAINSFRGDDFASIKNALKAAEKTVLSIKANCSEANNNDQWRLGFKSAINCSASVIRMLIESYDAPRL